MLDIDLTEATGRGISKSEFLIENILYDGDRWRILMAFNTETNLFDYKKIEVMEEPAPIQPEPSIPSDGPVLPTPTPPDWPDIFPDIPDEPTQPTPSPPPAGDDDNGVDPYAPPDSYRQVGTIKEIKNGHKSFYSFGPGDYRIFKFEMPAYDNIIDEIKHGWQIHNTPQAQEHNTVHLLVKRGSVPTVNDFLKTIDKGCGNMGFMTPEKIQNMKLFCKYNTGDHAEFIEYSPAAKEPAQAFYAMMINYGSESVNNQRLMLSILC